MFAILFEVLLIEIQEEIHHFAGWEGGGLRGTKTVNKHFVNKLAFPIFLGGMNCQLQMQNRATRRMKFHYRDRSPGISAESLSSQIQTLS